MGGHYKKQQRAEKAKVKLKGAKLPKGLNVTKTEFKVKKIQIRDQLKESQYVDGLRQFNLKETLTRLKHHGTSFRLEALRNLREAILAEHTSISGQLQDVIQGISAVCLDIEKEPRRESFNTLSKLLTKLTPEAVSPFFHIISSYLRCAMTHIHPILQEDSLLLLDVLLEHVPELVAEQSGKIFYDFLQMISKARAEGDSNRTLTINMGQKQTTIKWRAKVLQRLQVMLKTLYERQMKLRGVTGIKSVNYQMHTFNSKTPQYYSLKRKCSSRDGSAFFGLSSTHGKETDESTTIRNYIEHLMPLMLESWLEVRPQSTNSNQMTSVGAQLLLSQDAAVTLKVILDIIESLWSLADISEYHSNTQDLSSWFKKSYAEQFAVNFMHSNTYPYQQSECDTNLDVKKQSRKKTANIGDQYCLMQNISLTYLMSRFFGDRVGKKSEKYFIVLLEYLHTLVSSLKQHTTDHQHTLILALRAQLLTNGLALLQLLPKQTRKLLQITINSFLQQQFSNKEQNEVLILLCDIVHNSELFNSFGSAEFEKFLIFLPQLLLKSTVNQETLLSMSKLCKQKNQTFLQALAFRVEGIVDNIVKIQVQGAVNVFEGKKHIMNLFYWIDRPTNAEELCTKIVANITDKRIVSYFQFVLLKC